jgi:hypothetical protein
MELFLHRHNHGDDSHDELTRGPTFREARRSTDHSRKNQLQQLMLYDSRTRDAHVLEPRKINHWTTYYLGSICSRKRRSLARGHSVYYQTY